VNDEAIALYRALVADDAPAALAAVERCRTAGFSRSEVFERVIVPALSALGDAWAARRVSEDVLACSGVAVDQVMAFAAPPDVAPDTGIVVVVGTAEGDTHASFSTIVASALALAGHRVVDLGCEVPDVAFLKAADESGSAAVVVCASTDAAAAHLSRISRLLARSRTGAPRLVAAGSAFAADPASVAAAGARLARGAAAVLAIVAPGESAVVGAAS
jgi:methanogenic corrinoid protein MtbC1